MEWNKQFSFTESLGLTGKVVVSIVGAGGKTSLMYHLAREGRARGKKVLVTTSTKIFIPQKEQYDGLDLGGTLFQHKNIDAAGIYVGGISDQRSGASGKMRGVDNTLLCKRLDSYDMILIEADGSARKPLKGWNAGEPVVPDCSSHTLGVVDIQVIGKTATAALVHRFDIFTTLTGCSAGTTVNRVHLRKIIGSGDGLFRKYQGEKILYLNKVETEVDRDNAGWLKSEFPQLKIVCGSVKNGYCYG